MKKVTLKLSREIISAIITVCRNHSEWKSEDAIFDFWFTETVTELLLKFARLRNRTAKKISVTFSPSELLCLHQLQSLQSQYFPTSYETLMLKQFVFEPLNIKPGL